MIQPALRTQRAFVQQTITAAAVPRDALVYFLYSVYTHLGVMLWPLRLDFLRDPAVVPAGMLKYSFFYLIPVVGCLVVSFLKARKILFGLAVFLIYLIPTYSPVQIASPVAERYLYLPSLVLSMGVCFLYETCSTSGYRKIKGLLIAVLVAVAVALSVRTVLRNFDWCDSQTFWRKAALLSPGSWKAHYNLGLAYSQEEKHEEAAGEYLASLAINAGFADTYNNLGVSLTALKREKEAVAYFEKALEIAPGYSRAYYNLGHAYRQLKEEEKAIVSFKKALELDPGYAAAAFNLALLYYARKDYRQALLYRDEAMRLGFSVPADFLRSLEPLKENQGR